MHVVDVETQIVSIKLDGIERTLGQIQIGGQDDFLAALIAHTIAARARRVRPLLEFAEHRLDDCAFLIFEQAVPRRMRHRDFFPARERASLPCAIRRKEGFNVAQLHSGRILVVLHARRLVIIAAPDAPQIFALIAADDRRALRAEVDRADSVRTNVKRRRPRRQFLFQAHLLRFGRLLQHLLVQFPMSGIEIGQHIFRIRRQIRTHIVAFEQDVLD